MLTESPRTLTVLICDGLATDADIAVATSNAPYAIRIAFATAGTDSACTVGDHDDLVIVAASAADPFLTPIVHNALAELRPGHAITDVSHRELVGGTIAVPGVDIAIDTSLDLGAHALLVTLDDALRLLTSGHNATDQKDLVARTIFITSSPRQTVPDGWTVSHLALADLSLDARHTEAAV